MARPGLRQRLFLSSVELVSYDRQFDSDLEDNGKAKTQDLGSADGMCPLKGVRVRDHIEYCTNLSWHIRRSCPCLLSTVPPPSGYEGHLSMLDFHEIRVRIGNEANSPFSFIYAHRLV
jgi:hypothetical protein